MGVRILRICVALLLSIACSASAFAADKDNDSVTRADFDKAIKEIKGLIADANKTPPLAKPVDPDKPKSVEERLQLLEKAVELHIGASREQWVILNQITKRIDSKNNLYTLDIAGNRDRSPAFREEFSRAVDQSVRERQWGTLRIRSEIGTGQWVLVNGNISRYVPPFGAITLDVPVGNASVELPGYEAPKNWAVGPPNYEQGIVIRPAPRYQIPYPGEWHYDPATGVWSRIISRFPFP